MVDILFLTTVHTKRDQWHKQADNLIFKKSENPASSSFAAALYSSTIPPFLENLRLYFSVELRLRLNLHTSFALDLIFLLSG
jgi:hypothetical protein